MHINLEAQVSCFGDFPFPPDTPPYPDHEDMARYFRAYADHFGLTGRIRVRCRVARATGRNWTPYATASC